jgi:hypothetical protein
LGVTFLPEEIIMATVELAKPVSIEELRVYLSAQLTSEFTVSTKNANVLVQKGKHYGCSVALKREDRKVEVYPKVFPTPLTIGIAVAIGIVGLLVLFFVNIFAGVALIALNMFVGRIPAVPCSTHVQALLKKL